MKIKTITCHDVYNVGASLQAYALTAYLKSKGHEVEIINYTPDYLRKEYRLWGVNNPRFDRPIIGLMYCLAKLPSRIKAYNSPKKRNFDKFREEYLPVTEKRYYTYEQLSQNPPKSDLYIAGSDQIWNSLFDNGKDPAFYLQFAPKGSKRAAYAASFASDRIDGEYRDRIEQWLSEFDYIAVREKTGQALAKELKVNNAELVLDPVFLLEAEEWSRLETQKQTDERYVFVYDFDKNKEIEDYARNEAREKGLKIITAFPAEYADTSLDNLGPREFLSIVHNAELVVSNSFHATAFAIIFKRPFAVFDRNENINTRMSDLVRLLGLERVNKSLDNARMYEKLKEYQQYSKAYIEKITTKE